MCRADRYGEHAEQLQRMPIELAKYEDAQSMLSLFRERGNGGIPYWT